MASIKNIGQNHEYQILTPLINLLKILIILCLQITLLGKTTCVIVGVSFDLLNHRDILIFLLIGEAHCCRGVARKASPIQKFKVRFSPFALLVYF